MEETVNHDGWDSLGFGCCLHGLLLNLLTHQLEAWGILGGHNSFCMSRENIHLHQNAG